MITLTAALALFQVILLDICLSGDNAVVIAMAAASLPKNQRPRAIALGTIAAIILRIIFSVVTVDILRFPVVGLIGAAMLFWVSWKMFQEIRESESEGVKYPKFTKNIFQAVIQIVMADVSMSLDNVLAVAAAAHGHTIIMSFGLVFSIGLMAFAANYIAKLLDRWFWLKYIGLALILYVASSMMVRTLLVFGVL